MEQMNQNFLNGGGQSGISDRMRDLLSRAAQDHLSEQQSQGAVTEEMRQRLEGMEWLLREFREREFAALAQAVSTVQGRVDELTSRPPEWAEGLAEHIERVGAKLEPLSELPTLRSDLDSLTENVESVLGRLQSVADTTQRTTGQLDSLAQRTQALQEAMETRFAKLDSALEGLSARTEAIEANLTNLAERVEWQHEATLSRTDEQHDDLVSKLSGNTQMLTTQAEENHAEVTAALSDTSSAVSGLGSAVDGQISELQGKITELRTEVAEKIDASAAELREHGRQSVEGVSASLSEQLSALTTKLEEQRTALETAVGEARAGVDGLGSRTETRLAELEQRIDSGRQELANTVEGHLGEVREQVQRGNETLTGNFDRSLGRLGERLDAFEGHYDGSFQGVEGKLDGLHGKLDGVDGRVGGVEGKFEGVHGQFEGVDGRLEALDDRLESLSQRLSQLPATLEVAELHRRLAALEERPVVDHTERFDSLEHRLVEAVDPLLGELRSRPDRHEFEETVSEAVETSHDDITKRLAALEETMLALAEALLRPGQREGGGKKSGKAAKKRHVDEDDDDEDDE